MAELAFGVISLVAPSYHLYKRCNALIENYKGKGSGLRKCYNDLAMAEGIHRHEINQMLLLVVSTEEAERMTLDLDDAAWKEGQFVDQWIAVFGDSGKTMIVVINDTLKQLAAVVERVEKRLNADVGNTSSKRERLKQLKKDMYWIGSERPKIIQLVQNLQNDVTNLQRFRTARQKAVSSQTIIHQRRVQRGLSDPTEVLSRLLTVREVSKRLYESLEEMATCPCHSINLQLDVIRNAPGQNSVPTTKFLLILNKGGSNACGSCDCTSIVIGTEAMVSSSATLTSTTSIIVHNHTGHSKTPPKKRVRWSDQAIENSASKNIRAEEGCLAPATITVNFKKRSREFELETPDGKRFKISKEVLDAMTASEDETNSVVTATEDISSTSQSTLEVEELCSLVDKFGGQSIESDRFLLAKRRNTALDDEYCIYREQLERFRSTRHSLDTLITSKQRHLTLSERLQICLTLSISLLYFGSYSKSRSFFQESWRSNDIYFFDRPGPASPASAEETDPFIPYVVPRFNPENSKDSCAENELLFSLSVVMIETAMGRPLFEVAPRFNKGEPGSAFGEFLTARNLIDEGVLMKEVGATFSGIVNRCIRCDFDGSLRPFDLKQKEMQVAYYQTVVSQLNDLLKNFKVNKSESPAGVLST